MCVSQIYFSYSSSPEIGYCNNYKVTRPPFSPFFLLCSVSSMGTTVKLQEMSSATLQFGLTICRKLRSLFNFSFLFFSVETRTLIKFWRWWETNRVALWFATCSLRSLCYIIYQRQIVRFFHYVQVPPLSFLFPLLKTQQLEQLCSYKRVK